MHEKKSSTELLAEFLASSINQAADKRARQIQKEARFRGALGTRLEVKPTDKEYPISEEFPPTTSLDPTPYGPEKE